MYHSDDDGDSLHCYIHRYKNKMKQGEGCFITLALSTRNTLCWVLHTKIGFQPTIIIIIIIYMGERLQFCSYHHCVVVLFWNQVWVIKLIFFFLFYFMLSDKKRKSTISEKAKKWRRRFFPKQQEIRKKWSSLTHSHTHTLNYCTLHRGDNVQCAYRYTC